MSELGPDGRTFFEATRRLDEPTEGDRRRIRAKTLAAIAAAGASSAVATRAAATIAGQASAPTGLSAGWLGGAIKGALLAVAVLAGEGAIEIATGRGGPGRAGAGVEAVAGSTPGTAAATTAPALHERPDGGSALSPPPAAGGTAAEATVPREGDPFAHARSGARAASSAPPPPPEVSGAAEAARAPAASGIDEEIAALREAQEALRAGKPADAVRVLDHYQASHAGTALEEERSAARIVAACQASVASRSTADAERFLRERPDSPLGERVRAACFEKRGP